MTHDLLAELERRMEKLLVQYREVSRKNEQLVVENRRLIADREALRSRLTVILDKIEGI